MKTSLYDQIGEPFIRKAIADFYQRAFEDPILSHFFIHKDIHHLIEQQTDFAVGMLGGPKRYKGKPLAPVHHALDIRRPHFGRRQVLMAEVLRDLGLAQPLAEAWLDLELQLKAMILKKARV